MAASQLGHRRGAGGATAAGRLLPTALLVPGQPSGRRQPPGGGLGVCWRRAGQRASMCCRPRLGRGGQPASRLGGGCWPGRLLTMSTVSGRISVLVVCCPARAASTPPAIRLHDDGANQTPPRAFAQLIQFVPVGCSLLTSIILYEKTAGPGCAAKSIIPSAAHQAPPGVVATCPAWRSASSEQRAAPEFGEWFCAPWLTDGGRQGGPASPRPRCKNEAKDSGSIIFAGQRRGQAPGLIQGVAALTHRAHRARPVFRQRRRAAGAR